MEKKKIAMDLNFAVFLYLYIPILIFLCGWIKFHFSIPAVALIFWVIYKMSGTDAGDKFELFTKKGLLVLLGCAAFLLLWCVLSGLGAFTVQSSDWGKHNVLLEDLVSYDWPVRYGFHGGGVMDYYIAGYLFPALLGKMLGGIRSAEIALLLWTWLGLILTCVGIYAFLGCKKAWKLILICVSLFLFSTFIVPMSGVYQILRPEDLSGDGYMWLSFDIKAQYSSNITLLRWVFPQFVPTAVGMVGLLINKDKVENWGIFCAPIILYSTFCFVGMAALAGVLYFVGLYKCKDKKEYASKTFHWKNLCSLAVGALLCIYILGNVLQPKPEDVAMQFGLMDYSGNVVFLIVFQLSWMLWCFILLKRERKNELMYCAGLVLFLLPFFFYGMYNDLVMRSSIPALFVIYVLVAKNIVDSENDKFYRNLLIGCLVLNSVGSVNELVQAAKASNGYEANKFKYMSSEEFMTGAFGWQYVNWNEEDSVVRWIMK